MTIMYSVSTNIQHSVININKNKNINKNTITNKELTNYNDKDNYVNFENISLLG